MRKKKKVITQRKLIKEYLSLKQRMGTPPGPGDFKMDSEATNNLMRVYVHFGGWQNLVDAAEAMERELQAAEAAEQEMQGALE